MHRPTILILSTDPSFAREVKAKWPQAGATSRNFDFVVLDPSLHNDFSSAHYDLAIADASSEASGFNLAHADKTLSSAGKPAIIVHSNAGRDFSAVKAVVTFLNRESPVWAEVTGLLAREIVRRRQTESRCQEAEGASHAAQADATLGRYMLEMRVNVNNALTTLLGNAELLSNESGLPAQVQGQADAIRNMALRLHGIFQRFSMLEKELDSSTRGGAGHKTFAATGTTVQ